MRASQGILHTKDINCFIICVFLIIFIELFRDFYNIQQETQTPILLAP